VVALTGDARTGQPGEPAVLDTARLGVRAVNERLRALPPGSAVTVANPAGRHNLAVGLNADVSVLIDGPAGYYAGGLGQGASITINGPAGWGAMTCGCRTPRARSGGRRPIWGPKSTRAGMSMGRPCRLAANGCTSPPTGRGRGRWFRRMHGQPRCQWPS